MLEIEKNRSIEKVKKRSEENENQRMLKSFVYQKVVANLRYCVKCWG